ncbi:alpha-glucosidase [Roseburia sp. MUC/MUC-530-WT-4D]|uniref:Alpha-glucosidase n=1 Tax=Roseburia porci TaxID=2605790 RepID=A0A6L5YRW1_9FIRM|nr:alpha-glucosidase [Roseburia porci]MST74907.1 alpha-glucosidase [Roseburia porci]
MKKAWWKEAVVYQIYPRSFMDSNGDGIGDLNGITEKLDYLKELGIDVIWLSPVYQSPNDDNGYDISDYQAIMTEFGTMEDYDRMLARAHELGIKIMMDLVVNHTSDEHAWFVESRKSVDNPYRDFYIWRKGKEDGKEPNNWGSCFSGSAWKYDEQTDMYFLHLFSKKQPDLNWDNPKVRDHVFDMMNWWCEKGIDGFRMDVISLISKPEGLPDGIPGENGYADSGCANGPHVHEYLQEMNRKVLSKYDLITVGEAAGVTLEEAKKYANADGSELNMVFQFEHVSGSEHEKTHYGKWDGHKMPLPEWKANLSKWQTGLSHEAWNSLYLSNHDQPRSVSRYGNDSEEYRERSAKLLATCLHMMQGTPYVYQGEELGMCNAYFDNLEDYRDIESINAYHELTEQCGVSHEEMMGYLKRISRDNARTPMQWDDSKNAGFTTGTPWLKVNSNYPEVNAKAQVNDPDSVFSYYKKLIRLRHENEIIVYGDYELLEAESEETFIYKRTYENEHLMVLCNFTDHEVSVTDAVMGQIPDGAEKLIANYADDMGQTLRPYEAKVYRY